MSESADILMNLFPTHIVAVDKDGVIPPPRIPEWVPKVFLVDIMIPGTTT